MRDEAQIIEDYQSGMSTYGVAKKHGCSDNTVVNILKRNGIQRRTQQEAGQLRWGHIENLNEAQVVSEYLSGMSTYEVSKKHGCSDNTVVSILKRNGIKIRTRQEASQLYFGHIEPLNKAQIIEDYQSGMSTIQVGKKHGCANKTVNRLLKQNGIKIRTRQEACQLRYGHIEVLNEAQIIEDYQSGMTATAVGEKHGCRDNTVFVILKRNGISSRTKKEGMLLHYGHIETLNEVQIIEEYLSGLSALQVGKKHGCSDATVVRILKQNDIPRRTRQEANLLRYNHLGILDEDLLRRFKNKKTTT